MSIEKKYVLKEQLILKKKALNPSLLTMRHAKSKLRHDKILRKDR